MDVTRGAPLRKQICALVFAALVAAPSVHAGDGYPPKSHFTRDVYYGCVKSGDETNSYELDFKRDNTYRDRLSDKGGDYRYNRNRGKIAFQSGRVDRFFMKIVSHGGGIYEYKLKRQRDRSTWGECHPNPT